MNWSVTRGTTKRGLRHTVGVGAMVAGLTMAAVPVFADGTETLGPPSIPIASGTGVVAAGTGLITQPGTIDIDIPAGTSVSQALLYWEGHHSSDTTGADDTIVVDGNEITGTPIGGPTFFFRARGQHWSTTYRADVTSLALVDAGSNSLTVSGLEFDRRNNGAGLLVVFDDGGPAAEIGLTDGNDLAYFEFAPTLDTTVAQTFTFDPAPIDRMADVDLFFSSVADEPGVARPTVVVVTVGGVETRFPNLLDSNDGDEWDTVDADVIVPAGADTMTIQALSADDFDTGDRPASFAWLAAAAAVPAYVPPTTVPPTTEPPPTTAPPTTAPPTTEPPPTTAPPTTAPPTTEPPPTTAPPTTEPPPTTAPPTTAPPTTAPPTTEPPATTTSVAQEAVTTTTLAPELPETGAETTWAMSLMGAVLILLGGIMLLGSRRPHTVD